MKKNALLAMAAALFFGFGAPFAHAAGESSDIPLWSANASFRQDVEAASFEEAVALQIYEGKPLAEVEKQFEKDKGWKRLPHHKTALSYEHQGKGYYEIINIYPMQEHPDLVGDFRVAFYAREREMADEIFMQAEKNFSYTLGRPTIKRGIGSHTWLLSESSMISVEYLEYDPRLPVASSYPFEVIINRQHGDYHGYFVDKSKHE